jgi:hypothetical protein
MTPNAPALVRRCGGRAWAGEDSEAKDQKEDGPQEMNRFQFSLRTMLVIVVSIGAYCGFLRWCCVHSIATRSHAHTHTETQAPDDLSTTTVEPE